MLTNISPHEARRLAQDEGAALVDIREPDEYAKVHIAGSRLHPSSVLALLPQDADTEKPAVYFCHSGRRAAAAADTIEQRGHSSAYLMEGGLAAWQSAGLPVQRRQGPLPIMRQVQIAAGSLVLTGVLLGMNAAAFLVIPAFVGAGLIYAGISGNCGMAALLQRMPWNKKGI